MSEWRSAAQWAAEARSIGIDPKIMPHSERNVRDKAERDAWPFREREGQRGGGREYHLSVLPAPFRTAVLERLSHRVAAAVAAPGAHGAPAVHHGGNAAMAPAGALPSALDRGEIVGDTTGLTNAQRACMDARAVILAYVDRLAAGSTLTEARRLVECQARSGALPPEIARLAPVANAKVDDQAKRTLSARSLRRWHCERQAAGGKAAALAPKVPEPDMGVPPWGPALLHLYRTPQKRSLKEVVEQDLALPGAMPPGVAPPSYHQARRWLAKVCSVEKQRGRRGPKELRSLRRFVSRTTENLWPLDVVQADGHRFDAEVEHPRHHRPFKPELTTIIDLATRMVVGWSAGLDETALAVSDAIVYMAVRFGVPAVWYIDNGSGYNNRLMDEANTGLLHRLGVEKLNREAENPQAGGYVERVHQTLWIAGAKKLPTYLGRDMDRQAAKKIHKITRKELKEHGRSRKLMPWPEFIAWAEDLVRTYNNRPHRALPKISDPETGRRRHMTPVEAWNQAIAEGWQPIRLTAAEATDLTRPHEERTVSRGTVSILNCTYEHPDLESWHGEQVQVAFDIADASKVWVKDMEGRLICVAPFKPKVEPVPRSYLERAYDKRAAGRERRLMNHLDEVRQERNPQIIEATAVPTDLTGRAAEIHRELVIEHKPEPATAATIPETKEARFARWQEIDAALEAGGSAASSNDGAGRAGGPVAEADRDWHGRYAQTAEWRGQKAFAEAFQDDAPAGASRANHGNGGKAAEASGGRG